MRSIWFLFFPVILCANPSGEKVSAGDVAFERPDANTLHVWQKSDRAIVNWEGFSIAADELTQFVQPSGESAILNRVTGPNVSAIYGQLKGNGKIFLVNPHGVVVGPEGVIQTAGFLGTKASIDPDAFLKGEVDESLLVGSSDLPGIYIRPKGGQAGSLYELAVNREGREDAAEVRKANGRVFLADSSALLSLFDDSDDTGTKDFVESGLESLQQLRTLIPERLWIQQFSVYVNRKAFRETLKSMMKHSWMDEPRFLLGQSHFYFLRSTMAGEWIRIHDYYQEFEESPFWRNPQMMADLHAWEKQEMNR